MSEYFIINNETGSMGKINLVEKASDMKPLSSDIVWKILKMMKKPKCPMDLAKELGIHEQKIYYYIRQLRNSGFIEEVSTEKRHGTLARFYITKSPAIGVKIPGIKMEKMNPNTPRYNKNIEPFIDNGKINFRIVVGSPEPHGPFKARASDSMCAIDLGLFLGSFTSGIEKPNYVLDVEAKDRDLKDNLILIGGPVANMITRKIQKKLPVRILLKSDRSIFSQLSGKRYDNDNCGYIIVFDNPFVKDKKILLLAGKRFNGTRAAVIFLIKKFDKIFEGNRYEKNTLARIVKGYDMNGDGVIDTAELLE